MSGRFIVVQCAFGDDGCGIFQCQNQTKRRKFRANLSRLAPCCGFDLLEVSTLSFRRRSRAVGASSALNSTSAKECRLVVQASGEASFGRRGRPRVPTVRARRHRRVAPTGRRRVTRRTRVAIGRAAAAAGSPPCASAAVGGRVDGSAATSSTGRRVLGSFRWRSDEPRALRDETGERTGELEHRDQRRQRRAAVGQWPAAGQQFAC